MFPFRKKTFFHIEPSVSDPEILVLRFRRRILSMALLGSVIILAVPVFRDLNDWFHTHNGLYKFSRHFVTVRTESALKRIPMSLELSADRVSWVRKIYAQGNPCKTGTFLQQDAWSHNEIKWNLIVKNEVQHGLVLCFLPGEGLRLIDATGTLPFAPISIEADTAELRSTEKSHPQLWIQEEAAKFSIDLAFRHLNLHNLPITHSLANR